MRTAAERRMDADLRAWDFARKVAEAKAPTTHRLLRAVDDVLYETHPVLPQGAQRDELERLATILAWDAERGAEHSAKSAEYVDGLLAAVKRT